MKALSINCLLITFLVFITVSARADSSSKHSTSTPVRTTCYSGRSPCFFKRITSSKECPNTYPKNPRAKVCHLKCYSPLCKAERRNRKPNCSGSGAARLGARFIGGDGIVFYFHGRSNEHFSLVTDLNLQINARFIGLQPAGRTRDYTWIQALGMLFDTHSFSLEATPATAWDDEADHLNFSYDGKELIIPEGYPSCWTSPAKDLKIERTEIRNSVMVTLPEVVEISVNVVPVTKEDNRTHNYQIPSDNCLAYLEVQFRFFGISSEVEGVLGRTYRPDFKKSAKAGVVKAVVGGEDRYRTSSLLSADCRSCLFSPVGVQQQDLSFLKDLGMLGCSGSASSGNGIVCRK